MNMLAARRAGAAIEQRLALVETAAKIGRPYAGVPQLGELIIGFGDWGYVALYRNKPADDADDILAFGHLKEAGY